jgi:hypothetical protein
MTATSKEVEDLQMMIEILLDKIRELQKQLYPEHTKNTQVRYRAPESKLGVFIDCFNKLIDGMQEIEEDKLIYGLIKTGKFTEDETQDYIKKALKTGVIYERKTGVYAKA